MKLCFSTFAAVLLKCKPHTTSQVQLFRTTLASLHPGNDIAYSDTYISDLVHGKKNVPTLDAEDARKCNRLSITAYFSEHVIPLLDPNKKDIVILALKDIIKKDTSLANDTIAELVSNQTKSQILQSERHNYADFLAGIFLYVLIYVNNRGTRIYADKITDEYINQLSVKESDSISSFPLFNFKALPYNSALAEAICKLSAISCLPFYNSKKTDNC